MRKNKKYVAGKKSHYIYTAYALHDSIFQQIIQVLSVNYANEWKDQITALPINAN